MPNRGKKRFNKFNKNFNGHNGNNNNNGGVRKEGYKHGNNKLHINPKSIITSVSDDEVMPRANQNGNRYNSLNHERKSKMNRKNMINELKQMGKIRPGKMKIGDDEEKGEIKPLLPSKPHSQISNMPQDVFNIIVTFVQNYFNCYDTNREGLLGAYNKQCVFSLSLNMSNTSAYRQFKFDDVYIKGNRNLKRIVGYDDNHAEKRYRLQNKGYIDTLAQLCKLPPTEHDPRSFKLDIDYFTPQMIKFSLSGVFREGKSTEKVKKLRGFNRVFLCIPDTASPMTIINEQFIISHITNDQYKEYYKPEEHSSENKMTESPPKPSATPSTVPTTAPTAAALPTNQAQTNLPQYPDLNEQQKAMLVEFSSKSKLNYEWSKYCLEHVKWNFDDAAKAFVQFKDSIPMDAYI